ncbi:MAG TPA: glycosyltransferase family protein [Flavitalea sp.]|nr:glycosyltransferase family protein [Flavitalea sp.]
MKILYAIQGTGNGHMCRAIEIIPFLQKKGAVDILVSGTQSDVELPFDVKYKLGGLGFVFGKKGGVDLLGTYKKSHLKQLLKEVKDIPVEQYDLVISDFEPVSSWACYLRNKTCIALSHQAAVINKKSPRPKKSDPIGKAILKSYAPATVSYGFHFAAYDENIFTPVIRKEVRRIAPTNLGHYTVYLPAYSDKRIIRELAKFDGIKWEIFSKHFVHALSSENIRLLPIDNYQFIKSMASSAGVLCGAGFETPSEALYLGKKLLVVPMKNQFEQHCNAAALQELGVPVIKSLKEKHFGTIADWLKSKEVVTVDYPDQTQKLVDDIIEMHGVLAAKLTTATYEDQKLSVKKLRELTVKKILLKLTN